uniref:Reverse transcriptase/retrotransposon-derived protein RNase H-like domain-containing protein n=1 Tax=Romanomermis culicivorax TaxID=13658 RepID=A0A915JBB0_ROMCU
MKTTYAVYPNHQFPAPWEQHIHYDAVPAPYLTTPTDSLRASSQSSELQLALPALPPPNAASTPALETRANNHLTSTANIVIPSKGQFVIQTDTSMTAIGAILYQEHENDQWDNACADFLSRKDDPDKVPIPNTENLNPKIFRENFHPAGATMATDLTVPELRPAAASPPAEIDTEINANGQRRQTPTNLLRRRPTFVPPT